MRTRTIKQRRLAAALAVDTRTSYLIAALAGLPPNTLSGIVSGRVDFTETHRLRLAEVLGVDPDDLTDDKR